MINVIPTRSHIQSMNRRELMVAPVRASAATLTWVVAATATQWVVDAPLVVALGPSASRVNGVGYDSAFALAG
jgi:hypothetical protein